MKNILYIGNALSNSGKTITTIDILGENLKEFCTVYTASKKTNKFLRLLDMVKLVLMKQFKADYVLIDTYSTTNFYYALIISQLCRILSLKYIPILHGGNLPKRLLANPKLCYLIFGNAYHLVAPSNYLKSIFESYYHIDVIHIPNTIDIKKYSFKLPGMKGVRLLWVRSFSLLYNPNLAIEVAGTLHEKGHKTDLCMVGPEVDGSLKRAEKLSEHLNVKTTFTGKLDKASWRRLSDNHNIFINTTNFDNTPVSVIEAMALGLPVVSTNVGGMPYLIEDGITGLLVPPNNSEAMTKAIEKLISNPALAAKISLNARKQVEAFDWDIVKHKWLKLLK